jgi:hypothetical protein
VHNLSKISEKQAVRGGWLSVANNTVVRDPAR